MKILENNLTSAQALQNLCAREAGYTAGITYRARGEHIRALFPHEAARTIELAEQALTGMLVLPGTGPALHFAGNPPLWAENPCGDNEYTFHLNRMEHWQTMLEAYSMTGDERFAKKVLAELENWIDTVPAPPLLKEDGSYNLEAFGGLSCWRVLEIGIRGYRTWPFILEHLAGTGLLELPLFEKLLQSVYEHCRVLYEASPRIWPKADHNHYLMENLGLLSFSCMFPELAGAQDWKEHALRQLERCIDVQVTECGGQIEGCPSYHNGCVYWFSLEPVLAAKYGFTVSEHYLERLGKMFDHAVYATRPCGGNSPWGDSHTALKETMSLAAVGMYLALGDAAYLRTARHFYSMEHILEDLRENLWRVRDLERLRETLASLGSGAEPVLPRMAWQKELDQVYFRSGWGRDAAGVMTACRTPVQNLHAHMDPGGFDFTAYGEPLVCDPGIYTYKDCEERRWFKSIHWHNCLSVNRQDPWEYRGSWDYGAQKEGHIRAAHDAGRLQYAVSEHENYAPALCRRAVALIDGRFLLVADAADGLRAGDSVQVNFHVDRTGLTLDGACASSHTDGRPNVRICMSHGPVPQAVDAKVSTGNDRWHDSTIVRYESTLPQGGSCCSAALLIPVRTGEPFPVCAQPVVSGEGGVLDIRFTVDGAEYHVRWSGEALELI